ncbi:hypothetical protein [Nonomuraea salmonea]|uniref:hypothetical protein n=1 Tax=Nonomuraea salmonea TaxID=46181 RepID=UPI0031E858D3
MSVPTPAISALNACPGCRHGSITLASAVLPRTITPEENGRRSSAPMSRTRRASG